MRSMSWVRRPGEAYSSPGETTADVIQLEGSPWSRIKGPYVLSLF